jgi:hypothetical protein
METAYNLSSEQRTGLLQKLKERFDKNMKRHMKISWSDIEQKLNSSEKMILSLYQMEITDGEPDVVELNENYIYFVDCSEESPLGRRNLCFDRKALEERKANKPKGNACDMAFEMGIEILDEEQYRKLQEFGEFDTKTSSWISTPNEIRQLGGALFCDRRYNHTFTYHNGAQSYYSSRGFRGILKI